MRRGILLVGAALVALFVPTTSQAVVPVIFGCSINPAAQTECETFESVDKTRTLLPLSGVHWDTVAGTGTYSLKWFDDNGKLIRDWLCSPRGASIADSATLGLSCTQRVNPAPATYSPGMQRLVLTVVTAPQGCPTAMNQGTQIGCRVTGRLVLGEPIEVPAIP